MDFRVVIPAFIIFAVALVQQTPVAFWSGIRINFILIVLLVCVFVARGLTEYAVFMASAFLGSATTLPWDPAAAALAGVAVGAYCARRFIPWQSWVYYLCMLVVGTIVLYGLIDWLFLVREPFIVGKELLYTGIGGVIVYFYVARWHEQRTGHKF